MAASVRQSSKQNHTGAPEESQFSLRSVFLGIAALSAISAALSQGHVEYVPWVYVSVFFWADPRVIFAGLVAAVATLLLVVVLSAAFQTVPDAAAVWLSGLCALCASIGRTLWPIVTK